MAAKMTLKKIEKMLAVFPLAVAPEAVNDFRAALRVARAVLWLDRHGYEVSAECGYFAVFGSHPDSGEWHEFGRGSSPLAAIRAAMRK